MNRGKAEFTTMGTVDCDVKEGREGLHVLGRKIDSKNIKLDLNLGSRMGVKSSEIDPINPLNKGFDDDLLELKGVAEIAEMAAKPIAAVTDDALAYGVRKLSSSSDEKHPSENIKKNKVTSKSITSNAINAIKNSKLYKGSLIGLGGLSIATGKPPAEAAIETGSDVAKLTTKAFNVSKIKDVSKFVVPGLTAGTIGSDIANRLQDRRALKNREGMVKQIVEELKTNKE